MRAAYAQIADRLPPQVRRSLLVGGCRFLTVASSNIVVIKDGKVYEPAALYRSFGVRPR